MACTQPPLRLPLLLLLLSAAAVGSVSAAVQTLPLHELPGWRLDNSRGFGNVSLEGVAVPAAAQQLLYQAGIVGDPLYRNGELEQRWAAWDNWTFTLQFEAPPELLQHTAVTLHFAGLDTVAEVGLNSVALGRTANAHRPHSFDVTRLLSEGRNQLSVTLFSAPAYAAAQQEAYPYAVPANQPVGTLPAYNFIRKAASDFGWDWGPAFAPAGISGAVELRAHSSATLTSMAVRQRRFDNGSFEVAADGLLLPPAVIPAGIPAGADSAAQQAQQAEPGQLLLEVVSPDGQQRWQASADVSTTPAARQGAAPGATSAGTAGAAANGASADGGATASGGSCPWAKGDGAPPAKESAGSAGWAAAPPIKHSLRVIIDSPELWWPHDLGAQALYTLHLTYTPASTSGGSGVGGPEAPATEGGMFSSSTEGAGPAVESDAPAAEQDASPAAHTRSLSRRIGLRSAELATDALPGGAGETFFFRVNGQPLYARGANIVPAHIFEQAVTPGQLRRLVKDAKAAHMNMLRVWGGGRYFPEAFYDACDEAGVLVWQEAMFACAVYPRDAPFLREAWLEVTHHVARLSSHPSVVIWGGNNENEASFDWFLPTQDNPKLYASDFSKLFVDVVREAVLSVDRNTTYVDTSPSNGLVSREPYVKRWGNVADPSAGDVHYYNYVDDALSPATYPPAKFVSEYGFMSLPSMAAYKQVTAPEDWALSAPMLDFRMRHSNGLAELAAQLERHFLTLPPQQAQQAQQQPGEALLQWLASGGSGSNGTQQKSAALADLVAAFRQQSAEQAQQAQQEEERQQEEAQRWYAAFTYLTQLQQGLAYETAVHQWRRNKGDPGAQTMGVLYWQLNDIWQGPSWSSINSDGSWRLVHHLASRFFRPVLVSGVRSGGGVGDQLEVHLTNDLSVGVTGELTVEAIPYAATRPNQVVPLFRSASAVAPAFDSRLAWTASLASDVLPAVGATSGSGSGPADAAAFFIRLRFCPTAVSTQQDGGETGGAVPNPFVDANAASAGSQDGDSESTLVLGSSSDGGAAERQAATSDGSKDGQGRGPCEAPVALPGSASAAQCAAARRLLQCSESLVFLTELKEARLAPAHVSAAVLPAGTGPSTSTGTGSTSDSGDGQQPGGSSGSGAEDEQHQSGGGGGSDSLGALLGSSPSFAVHLSSDAVALFVSVEVEQQAGRFNNSALLLLPWQPQVLLFDPSEAGAAASPTEGGQQPGARPGAEGGAAGGAAPAAEGAALKGAGSPAGGAPQLAVYWLQQEMGELQGKSVPASGGGASARPGAGAMLAAAAVLCCSSLLNALLASE